MIAEVEMWKIIEGYKEYSISSFGNVKNNKTQQILRPNVNMNGYEYVVLCYDTKRHTRQIHRLVAQAFLQSIEGCELVDHKDSNKTNNHFNNLRFVTKSQNEMNKGISKANTSGIRGVSFCKQRNCWRGRVKLNGKDIHIGFFKTLDEAKVAMKIAHEKYFGEYRFE